MKKIIVVVKYVGGMKRIHLLVMFLLKSITLMETIQTTKKIIYNYFVQTATHLLKHLRITTQVVEKAGRSIINKMPM